VGFENENNVRMLSTTNFGCDEEVKERMRILQFACFALGVDVALEKRGWKVKWEVEKGKKWFIYDV
jgi:hypothetical protein